MIHIDYNKIGLSQFHYEKVGFAIVDAPWWVTKEIIGITSPPFASDRPLFYLPQNDKCLVSSGEQGFLYLAAKGLLPKGRFQAVTPCFRNEPQDGLHRKNFIKNELIDTKDVSIRGLEAVIDEALKFFAEFLPRDLLKVEEEAAFGSSVAYDITCGGIELGSYGIRSCDFLDWVYGTGCAEPRLSAVIHATEKLKTQSDATKIF
jgi:hypothetical protein